MSETSQKIEALIFASSKPVSENEIKKANQRSVNALKERFVSEDEAPKQNFEKSEESNTEEFFITEEGLDRYKSDLFKSIDAGEVTDESLEKSLDQISSLVKTTRNIEGKEVTVYIRS